MCGIAGIAGKKDEVSVQSMLRATAHRGPDDSGMYADELCTTVYPLLT
jgi:asparagine synthetase B (glutamine-hydrolysing)